MIGFRSAAVKCQGKSACKGGNVQDGVASCWLGKGLVAGGGERRACHVGPFLHFLSDSQGIRQTALLHELLPWALEQLQQKATFLKLPGDIAAPSAPEASPPLDG